MTRTLPRVQGRRIAGAKGTECFDFPSHERCKYIAILINSKPSETIVRRDDPDGVGISKRASHQSIHSTDVEYHCCDHSVLVSEMDIPTCHASIRAVLL